MPYLTTSPSDAGRPAVLGAFGLRLWRVSPDSDGRDGGGVGPGPEAQAGSGAPVRVGSIAEAPDGSSADARPGSLAGAGVRPGDADEATRDERLRSAERLDALARAGEDVLAEIEALERAKARVEADLLAAYGTLHSIEAQQIEALPAGAPSRLARAVSTDRVVGEEIALATGVGPGEVARRLALATSPRRHRLVLRALRDGAITLQRALQVVSETACLSDADVATVEESVLAPTRDGLPLSQRTFTSRLRRAVAAVDELGAAERRSRARVRRGVYGRMVADGMGCLTMTTDAATIAAILDRLDAAARTLRAAGDPRTLDQLRCDLMAEALLRGHLGAARNGAPCPGCGAPDAPNGDPREGSASGDPREGSASGDPRGSATVGEPDGRSGEAPARAWIVVPFEVAVGLSDAPCELPGHGWVTAEHARAVITRPGSVWHTLPVDVRTGEALGRPTAGYRPTAAMVAHVRAVDGTCRAPGCEVLADRCDTDHEVPYPAGPTAIGNLVSKHRHHHNLKTAGVWTSRPVPGGRPGTVEWTTLTGRTYLTRPKNWRTGVGIPPTIPPTGPPTGPPPSIPPPF